MPDHTVDTADVLSLLVFVGNRNVVLDVIMLNSDWSWLLCFGSISDKNKKWFYMLGSGMFSSRFHFLPAKMWLSALT